MKAVILAGGLGTRISEETHLKPKPMVEIGNHPVLWHIMKIYSSHGINDFVICCGYKGYMIKEYFSNYSLHNSDITIDFGSNKIEVHAEFSEDWKVTLVDTGLQTMTGGRLKRVADYLDDEDFCFTYGDGLSDVNISNLIEFHKNHQRLATVTVVQPPGRFGNLKLDGIKVTNFSEKPEDEAPLINGGFFVLNKEVINYIDSDDSVWESDVLPVLAKNSELFAYKHENFWQPMDTKREKDLLNQMWISGNAPWKNW